VLEILDKAIVNREPPLHRGKPRKKVAYWESKKAELGRLQAQSEHYRKTKLSTILKEKALSWLDHPEQVMEVGAIASGTFIVHTLIIESPELQKYAAKFTVAGILLGGIGLTAEAIMMQLGIGGTPEKPLDDKPEYWVVSFFIAYVCVKHAGSILALLEGGASKLSTIAVSLMQ
jgi:hypothetical protein